MKLVGGLLGIDGTFFKDTWESIKKLPATILKHLNNFGTKFGTWFKTLFDFSTISSSIASLINLTSILPNIIKEYLLDPAVTWLGDKFGFDTSWFTSRSVGEIIVDGAKFFFKKLMDFFDFDIKFDMPDWDVLQSFKDLVRPLLEKASWVVPDSLLDWVRAKKKPEIVVPPTEPPKTPAEIQAETKTREDTRGLKKGEWLQREKKKWSISSGRPAAEFGKAHGGAAGIKDMFGAYKGGQMPTPQPMSELEQIQKDEGFESGVYKDTMGIKTIGYGFNLERAGAQEALDKAGIKKSLADLSSGDVTMTEEEASRLMLGEMPHFKKVAERFVGKETWKNLSGNRQGIITNMAYNMGEGTLNKFKKLKAAIKSGDWQEAQVQMKDSSWSKQVKGRSDRLIARMGQNDTGTQLASAQSTSDSLGSSGGGGVIIAPNNVTNSTTNSSPMYAHETTHRDTEMLNNTAILDA
jgi:GH24 family phage-related lysozyme (muramidase)